MPEPDLMQLDAFIVADPDGEAPVVPDLDGAQTAAADVAAAAAGNLRSAADLELEIAERELLDLERRAKLPKTFSVSLLQWTERCMFGAKLSREHNYSGPEANVGSAIHEVLATLDMLALTQGREHIPVDEAMAVAQQTLATSSDLATVPLTLQGYVTVMDMVANWAIMETFPTDADLWEVELPVESYLDNYRVTGRIDRLIIKGTHADIRDYKTGGWTPDQDEVEEEHSQLPMYAWHVWRRYPYLRTFTCTEEYLREGEPRTVHLDLSNIAVVEDFMRIQVNRTIRGLSVDEPEANPGGHCAICPNASLCPVPKEDRPASIEDEEEAQERAGELLVLDAQRKQRSEALQAHCKQDDHPGFLVVGNKKIGYHKGTEKQLQKDRLGQEGEPEDFYEDVPVKKWGIRNVAPARGKKARKK